MTESTLAVTVAKIQILGTQISADLLGRYLVPMNAFSQRKVPLVGPQVHEVNDYPRHEESEVTTKGVSLQITWG